ncbi:MAG: DUF1638 domain-containing protein [Candidatus Thiodiazotropha sp. (ex Dulcina madagascariensis)]|nr:DUF1638 domain-containing protein [Candidatus Thiodiazotropha sp. (ex Dulcina madagascariensis)]
MVTKADQKATLCLACSVFRPELTALVARGELDCRIRYLSSTMHMVPVKLDKRMQKLVGAERKRGHRVLMAYGDCHPHMHDLEQADDVVRTRGMHCGEILLGKKRYKELLREKAFLLLPEWAMRWREILTKLEDLDEASTIELLRERHDKFVYLDTGVVPIPVDEIRACAAYFDLPLEIEVVSLEYLQSVIKDAQDQLEPAG